MNMIRQGVIGILVICIIGCEQFTKKKEQTPVAAKPPAPVEAITVAKGIISRDVHASGVAAGIRESYVVSETQGKIEKVSFALGQWVKKGQVLVAVNSAIQHAAYEQAKRAASAAELNLKVTRKLFNEGNASDAELKNAQSQATGARAQLESAQKAYNDCRITAPISGYIAQKELTIAAGNVLAGGTLVARIVDISSLKATVAVGEMEIGIIKKGMAATIQVPAVGNKTFAGRVTAIAAGSDPATGSYPVEIVWKNTRDRAIKSGMSIKAIIATQETDSVIIIPSKAIVEKDRKDAVFLAIDGKAAIRFITTGRIHGTHVEIIDGVDIGDIVLTSGMTVLSRGDSIAVTLTDGQGGTE